ncbi:MAG TPA: cytochrome c biogenesis protein CcsA [Thermoanaerobaculia bacterium]
MIPALGRLLILGSLLAAAAGAILGFAAGRTRSADGLKWARRFAYLYSGLIVSATLLMVYALLAHDFSVSYVAQVGSRTVPTWITVVSLWSSLEGSILFWGLVLGAYIAVATFLTRNRYEEYQPDAIGVWLACAAFFSFLIAGPANPFHTVPSPPMDGPGPNPLLQNHILMAIHPPFLYLGYVGFTIPFGFACAALMKGRLGHNVLKPLRESLMLPWIFQSVAIMLGGWWAYEVLGWGGYWAWDPVENASLLPWLTGTAFLHSIMIQEKRGMLRKWNVTLVVSTFLLSILGTFITRSGIIESVHSFAQSPVGNWFAGFLIVSIVVTAYLVTTRLKDLEAQAELESMVSREAAFLYNNLVLVGIAFSVLWGTLFPIISEAVRGEKITVGPPFFNTVNVPLGLLLLGLTGVGPLIAWRRASVSNLRRQFTAPVGIGLATGAALLAIGMRDPYAVICYALAAFVLGTILQEFQ